MSDSNNLINGPINIVRMEGHINDIKKVAYFYLDVHVNIKKQTRCPSFDSLDLYQYFSNNLHKSNHTIDFMFEITQNYLNKSPYNFKDIYIKEVVDFFNYNYNKKDNTNIRYHFIDIRDYIFNTINHYNHKLNIIINEINSNNIYHSYQVDDIKFYLNKLMTELDYWENLIFGNLNNLSDYTTKNNLKLNSDKQLNRTEIKNNIKKVPKFILKIREKYTNKIIKDNLQDIFNLIRKYFDDCRNISLNIINIFDKNNRLLIGESVLFYDDVLRTYRYGPSISEFVKVIKNIFIEYRKLSYIILKLFSNLMDIYFLRRFLDKDYIQHAIIYTGANHSINYIQHLLTKYDFKITHVSYSLEKDIDKLNNHLKSFNNTANRTEYEKYLYIPNLIQCSSIDNFPKNFK